MNGRTVEIRKWQYGSMQYGCKRDAIAALDGTLPFLGAGAIRNTYKGARGIVYKVGKRGNPLANTSEYERMLRIAEFDHSLATPCTLYVIDGVPVIAMVERPHDAREMTPEAHTRLMEKVARYNRENAHGDHIGDMHRGNWRGTPQGRPTVTDVGDVIW